MKILFLSHKFYPHIGGIEINSEILATAFSKAGCEVHLTTWSEFDDESNFLFSVLRNPSIPQLVREHRWADVVFENNPTLRLSWPAFLLRKPLVVALRTWISRPDGSLGIQDRLKFQWLRIASAVIAVSESVREKCWPAATVIGNPYRNNIFKVIPDVERNKDFVFLGRLVSDKGAALAIQAIYHMVKEDTSRKNCALTIIGDGPEQTNLIKLVNELNLNQNVFFKGALRGESLVQCLNRHRYILIPSIWEEPFGNVALEGMACGCVPIVSDGGGLPDAVGKAGLVFKRGDVSSLLSCLKEIMSDSDLVSKLQSEAKLHLEKHYPTQIAKRYLQVIEQAIK